MKTTTAFSTVLALIAARPAAAQSDSDTYVNSVCSPQGDFASGSIPPCIDIINIEGVCAPNGTDSLALQAHAQCICNGSYFAEWLGCRQCLFDHGGMSERNLTYYKSVISTASNLLCTGTPTAAIQTLFASAAAEVPIPTTGGTVLSDIAPSNTAVSVYYTATGAQGAGQITGSATAATATAATTSASGKSTSGGTTGGSSGTKTGASSTTKSTTSSSSNVAAATGAAAGKGLLLAVAGGALMAAL